MRKHPTIMSLNTEIKAKQDIKMPGKKGIIIPKGTPFVWSPRVKHFLAHLNGKLVAQVNADYVDRVHIFEL